MPGATPRKTNWLLITLFGAAGFAMQAYNLATDAEAPSNALLVMRYIGMGLGLIAGVGGLFMMMRSEKS